MGEMTYYYDGTMAGFLCCIFESYASHEPLSAISADADPQLTLYAGRFIPTDLEHARRVLRKVSSLSSTAGRLLRDGFLTCLPEREIRLYHLVGKLLREGPGFLGNLSDETLYPVIKAVRHLYGEVHLLKGFVRFSDLGGILAGEIEPKNRVLPLLRGHFCARYPEDPFFLFDRTHKEALFHTPGRTAIQPLDSFQMGPADQREAAYRLLWKQFYDTVAIPERYNPRCRQTQMPKRYWNTMTEFQDAGFFTPQSSPAAVSAPGVPTGRSVPGIPLESGPSGPGSGP